MIALGKRMRQEFLESHLDRPLEVLVEDERVVEGTDISSGQTGDYVRVWFPGRGLLGEIVEVQGDEIRSDGISGRVVEPV